MGLHIKRNGTVKFDSANRVRIDCTLDAADFVPGTDSIITAMIEDDAVTVDKIADDAVDSDQIAAGAVDLAHMSANSVDSDQYVDGSIDTVHIAAGNVTLPKISFTGSKILRFDGGNGAGAQALVGAAVGDRVVMIWGITSSSGAAVIGTTPTQFEATITVVDQIQQADVADLSGNDYWVLLAPATA